MNLIKNFFPRLISSGPIVTIVLILNITTATIYYSILLWPSNTSYTFGDHLRIDLPAFYGCIIMYNFLRALTIGPGYLTRKWYPANSADRDKLKYCTPCQGYKVPRAHHCQRCQRCVLKMDHHCVWINNCVGHQNQFHFIAFLFYASLGCSHGAIILFICLITAVFQFDDPPLDLTSGKIESGAVPLSFYDLSWITIALACALAVACCVGCLFVIQMMGILRNVTTIEHWIVDKAEWRRKINSSLAPYIHPYDFGWEENLKFVFNLQCKPKGDGINWPVVRGCDQFTLTMEQLEHKEEKRKGSKEYLIVEDYNGSWCPVSKGFDVVANPPMSDKARIPLNKFDRVIVTQWERNWLYGYVVSEFQNGAHSELKGWFPRRCAVKASTIKNTDSGQDPNPQVSQRRRPRSICRREREPPPGVDDVSVYIY